MALYHAHSVSLPPLPPQHSLPQLPPQHYLTPQLSMSHSLAPQHSTPLLPQHSMPLLPQHSTPLLQTLESRLVGPETSLDIGSMQLPEASAGSTQCCQAGLGSQHCSSASLSSSTAAGAGNIGACRICFEQDVIDKPDDPSNPLIVPCQCTGSSKYVHRLCLKQWREKKHRSDASFQCEVCKYRYRYRRLWWSHFLGHHNTLTALFMVTLIACIALLGFVPITNSFFLGPTSSSSSSSMFGGFGTAGRALGLVLGSSSGSGSSDIDPLGGSYIGSRSGSSSIGGAGIGLPGTGIGSNFGGSQGDMQQHAAMRAAALPHLQHTRPQLPAGIPAGVAAAGISTLPASPISYFVVHAFNGLIVMALLGLMLSLMMKVGRAFGLPALALLPDPWSSTGACLWCMDMHGGLSPFVQCSSSAGECGIAVLVIMTVLMLMLGLVLAAYLLYGVLWVLVQAGLSKAQQLVENVQQHGKCKNDKECKEAKGCKA